MFTESDSHMSIRLEIALEILLEVHFLLVTSCLRNLPTKTDRVKLHLAATQLQWPFIKSQLWKRPKLSVSQLNRTQRKSGRTIVESMQLLLAIRQRTQKSLPQSKSQCLPLSRLFLNPQRQLSLTVQIHPMALRQILRLLKMRLQSL